MLPEILRENLGLALLKLFQVGINDPLNYDFVESPELSDLNKALRDLNGIGALEENDSGTYKLTLHGKIMACVEMQPRLGKFIALGIESGIPMEAMIIASICSVGTNVFFRAGSNEEKQIADRLKTKFCNELGDMLTLLSVYKEWDAIENNKKNKWCKENSMNAKTLRFTRDTVHEVTNKLSKLLKMKLTEGFNEIEMVNYIVPDLLVRCYTDNLAYYSGHKRGGYNRLFHGYENLSLHPSSSLSMLSVFPVWVVYESILTTSKPFLINVTVVPDDIVERRKRLIEDEVVRVVHNTHVTTKKSQRLGLGRWDGRLEREMKKDIHKQIFIDRDQNTGEASLFTNAKISHIASKYFKSHIEKEDVRLKILVEELPISEDNPVSVVISQGGCVSDILYSNEFISIIVRNPLKKEIPVEHIDEKFSIFGQISDIISYKPGSFYWGKVVFTNKEAANKALEEYGSIKDEDDIQIKGDVKNKSPSMHVNKNYFFKASWIRRRGKGIGFLTFHNPEDAQKLIELNTIECEFGDHSYSFETNVKNNDGIVIRGINSYLSNEQVKNSIENQFPEIKIKKCNILRHCEAIESNDLIQAKERQLKMKISNYLNEYQFDDKAFNVFVHPTFNETNHEIWATITFNNVKLGQKLLHANLSVGNARVVLKPNLLCFILENKMHDMYKDDIESIMKDFPSVDLTVRMKKIGKIEKSETILEANSFDDLITAREAIGKIIQGVTRMCTKKELRYFKTPKGRTYINSLRKSFKSDIQINYQTDSLIIYTSRKYIKKIEDSIKKTVTMLNNTPEDHLILYLNKKEFPKGFVKLLLIQYGVDFAKLYEETGVSYININYMNHTMDIFGGTENLNIFKNVINQLQSEVNIDVERRGSAECPICFDVLERNSYQLELCLHSYCNECIESMCQHAVDNRSLPITCAFDGCNSMLCISDLISFVTKEKLASASLQHYVGENQSKYRYCLTPNCSMVYRRSAISNPDPFLCPICQVLICTYCNARHHTNISCAMYNGKDDTIKVWLSAQNEDRGLCPSCGIPIEKNGGCMQITCRSCRKHVCWRCKTAVFDTKDECNLHRFNCSGPA